MKKKVFTARAAWVNGRELRSDVAIVVESGVVTDILPIGCAPIPGTDAEVIECGLLLPGFINSHCHLEYTHMAGKLMRGNVPFGDWLADIVRKKTDGDDFVASAREGVRQLVAGGTTTVVETVSMGASADVLADSGLRYALSFELLGLDDSTGERAFEAMVQRMDAASARGAERCASVGFSRHAPYTVGKGLRKRLREFAARRPEVHCGWHLHESRDEMEFFATGEGSIYGLLKNLNTPMPFDAPPGVSPMEFLQKEELGATLDTAYHLNYASPAQAAYFAAPGSVVHCPGTHQYFQRKPFPMQQYLAAGANVCLGTDSLASSDSLSMLENLKLAGKTFPMLSGPQLLDLVTRNPARSKLFSGMKPRIGVIERGAAADFTELKSDVPFVRELRSILIDASTRVEAGFVSGTKLHA